MLSRSIANAGIKRPRIGLKRPPVFHVTDAYTTGPRKPIQNARSKAPLCIESLQVTRLTFFANLVFNPAHVV